MSGLTNAVGGGLGTLPFGNMIDSFLHPEKAYQKAEEQQQQYYKDAQGKLQPYNQNGLDQYNQLNQQGQALNNPIQLENQWAQSYNESPYAQQMTRQATEAGLGAASSMGLMGSSAALNNIQQSAGDIAQADRQKYMDDLMQKYMASIGLGQNLYSTGAGAAGAQSQNDMNEGQESAANAYGQQAAPGALLGDLISKGTDAGINYATGGLSGVAKGMKGGK